MINASSRINSYNIIVFLLGFLIYNETLSIILYWIFKNKIA